MTRLGVAITTLAAAVTVHMSGCASIVTGQDQVVSVTTPLCPGAQCELLNEEGAFYVHKTPGSTMVNREYGDLLVTCSKSGYDPFSMNVSSSTKAMAFGNILLGGVVGAAVDMGTGAAYDYPPVIVVPLDCRSTEEIAAAPTSGAYAADAAKLVDLEVCQFPEFVLKDQSGEVYKSRCLDGKVGVIRCLEGVCEPLNVANRAQTQDDSERDAEPIEPKNDDVVTQIGMENGCTGAITPADVSQRPGWSSVDPGNS